MRSLLTILLLLFFSVVTAQPRINYFSPMSGPVGTVVTITGSGFSPSLTGNKVFFGPVSAKPISASSSVLQVYAPFGTNYENITVTTSGATAFSRDPFVVTHISNHVLNQQSFPFPYAFWFTSTCLATNYDNYIAGEESAWLGDYNNDGQTEIFTHLSDKAVWSVMNFSNGSIASMLACYSLVPLAASGQTDGFFRDIDGDGQRDMVVCDSINRIINVCRRSNTLGNGFTERNILHVSGEPMGFILEDMDKDGKPDIIAANHGSNTLDIFLNTSVGSAVSFSTSTESFSFSAGGIAVAYMDDDDLPDLVITEENENKVAVYRNISTQGHISFSAPSEFNTPAAPQYVIAGDIDDDLKQDLVISCASSPVAYLSVLINSSVSSTISFASPVSFPVSSTHHRIALGDLDGDGKIDIGISNYSMVNFGGRAGFSLFLNESVPGNIALSANEDYYSGERGIGIKFADMSNDGRLDVIIVCKGPEPNNDPNHRGYIGTRINHIPYKTCTGQINSFPYHEGFETAASKWVCDNDASFWTWGKPDRERINTAGEGNHCWYIRKDLYNSVQGQNSLLRSPCFDFSTLVHPVISFKTFWETGIKMEGANLQYSDNGGLTWNVLGNANSNNECSIRNWYTEPIVNLLQGQGWSGNALPPPAQCPIGGGSGGWVTATHPLEELAGKPSVQFRFVYATGQRCAEFNDFAIDDIRIFEAPENTTDFSYTCDENRKVNFLKDSPGCSTGSSWDFGDPASGANNFSVADSPSHVFSSAGTYTVTLSSSFASGPQVTVAKSVTVIDAAGHIDQPLNCAGQSNAVISITGSNTNTYTWDTNPVQTTQSISGIGPGTYHAIVNEAGLCPIKITIVLTDPTKNHVNLGPDRQICPGEKLILDPGNYASYLWQDNSTAQVFTVTQTGSYSVTVVDDNGCSSSDAVKVLVDCSDIYFPSAFTPNGDGRNDLFGPAGTGLSAVKNYSFRLYNRYSQLIFESNDPFKKWDGRFKDKSLEGGYVWIASYTLNGKEYEKKGSVLLIR